MKLFKNNGLSAHTPELEALADRELALRSPKVAFILSPITILIILITDLKNTHLIQSSVIALLFILFGLYRIYLFQRFDSTYHDSPRSWFRKFGAVVLMTGLVCGLALPVVYFEKGSEWTFIICLLMTTGITAGATGSLSPRLGLFRLFVGAMSLPIIISLLAFGNLSEMGLGLLLVMYQIYVLAMGGYFNQIFWSGLRDGHLLKERAAALEIANAEVKAANQAKGEFLTNISHEIRTPLNGILGMTELVLDGELSPQQRENLKDVFGSGQTLLHTINELLDFSRIEAGNMTMETSVFSLPDTLQKIIQAFGVSCIRRSNNLHLSLGPDFPDLVTGDSYRIEQILTNLMSNAVKFTRDGDICLSAEVVKRTEGQVSFTITVQDSGIGIGPEDQKTIFQAFKQADCSTTRGFGGTGLGLAICRHLVRLMGGEITLKSNLHRGSEFTIHLTLPEVRYQAQVVENHSLHSSGAYIEDDLRGLQVLLVEDNTVNAKLATRVLEKLGIRVTWAKNGQEGVAKYYKENFDLVLMDIQMPVLDGFGATEAIRQAEKKSGQRTPIVALTAHAIKGYREKCLDAGMDDYLTKPLQPRVLRDTLGKWTSRTASPSSP